MYMSMMANTVSSTHRKGQAYQTVLSSNQHTDADDAEPMVEEEEEKGANEYECTVSKQ
jgi:hypothetical protein